MSTLHLDKRTNNYIIITLAILIITDIFLGFRLTEISSQQESTNKTLDERGAMGVVFFAHLKDMQKEINDIKISIKNIDDNIAILAKRKNENHK